MTSRPTHRLCLDMERERDTVKVVVGGDLDRISAGGLRDVCMDVIDTCSHVSVDLAGASVIDSTALGVLIELYRAASAAGRGFDVIIGPPFQRTLFTTTGLADYFDLIQAP